MQIVFYSVMAAFTYPLPGEKTVEKVKWERRRNEEQKDPEPKPTDFS